jgi:hypothetical protein
MAPQPSTPVTTGLQCRGRNSSAAARRLAPEQTSTLQSDQYLVEHLRRVAEQHPVVLLLEQRIVGAAIVRTGFLPPADALLELLIVTITSLLLIAPRRVRNPAVRRLGAAPIVLSQEDVVGRGVEQLDDTPAEQAADHGAGHHAPGARHRSCKGGYDRTGGSHAEQGFRRSRCDRTPLRGPSGVEPRAGVRHRRLQSKV